MQPDIQAQNNAISANQAISADQAVSADQVSDFLRQHPHFFEQHASLLSEIYLPSPHGSGAISLAERQQLAQRDKIRMLEAMLAQLIESANENDATSAKVHALSIKLIGSQNFGNLQQRITESMQQDFSVTQPLLRIWLKPDDSALAQDAVFTTVDEAFSDWVVTLSKPFCGSKPALTGNLPALADHLLDDQLQSFAFIPLYKTQTIKRAFGVLILGSEYPQRFKTNMGTVYLELMGELISAALAPYI